MSNTVNIKFVEAQNALLEASKFKGEWSEWNPSVPEALLALSLAYSKAICGSSMKHMQRSAVSLANYASKLFEALGGEVDYAPTDELSTATRQRDELQSRFTRPVVCLCGSTKFKQSWISENARLTGEGEIVLAVGLWGHHEQKYPDAETKIRLDETHKRKIDLCDYIYVLNVNAYIGDSTKSEIEYARSHGKPVKYLLDEFPDYIEPIDALQADKERLDWLEAGYHRPEFFINLTGEPDIRAAIDSARKDK